jgi:hypothetical protein
MRGGKQKCPYGTKDEQQTVNLWKTACRILNSEYDNDYRCEWHVIQSYGTCNMWVWKDGETSKEEDKHLDVYWENWNRAILGVSGSYTISEYRKGKWVQISKENVGYRSFDLSDYIGSSQQKFGEVIAESVDESYREFFYE